MKLQNSILCAILGLSFFSAEAFAASKAPRPAKGDVQIEISLTGIIQKTGTSFCMDGAKYQIRHFVSGGPGGQRQVTTRLMTSNAEAEAFLKKVAGSRQRVTVTGYPHQGVECPYLSVYYAGPAL